MAKRPHAVSEKSKENLKKGTKFSVDNVEHARECNRKSREARKLNKQKQQEIESSAKILIRLLQGEIKNNTTGETITQKEAMLLTLLTQGIKEKNLKAIEMILKIIGDFTEYSQNNVVINQPVKIDKTVIHNSIKEILTLAEE